MDKRNRCLSVEFSRPLLKASLTSSYRDGHVARSLNKIFMLDDEFQQNILNDHSRVLKNFEAENSVPTQSDLSHLPFWQEDSVSPPLTTYCLMKRGTGLPPAAFVG